MRIFRYVFVLLLVLGLAGSTWVTYRLYQQNVFIWLGDYLFNSPSFEERDEMVDIIFVIVDHWEPGGHMDVVNDWMAGWQRLADKHVDDDGVKLQHTWYYPLDKFHGDEVDSLVKLCANNYGDVEVHLHHHGDNSESLRAKFVNGLDSLRAHGALVAPDSGNYWSFIHGNWALDNSRFHEGRDLCGVDDEITILKELGCYGDFTFPAMTHTAQPSLVNKIYYCIDDPDSPKSHDTGIRAQVGRKPGPDEFMIFQGSYTIDWSDWRFGTHPTFEDGNLYWEIETSFHRFEEWLDGNVHVEGQPDWVFVRPFTHGAMLAGDGYDNILGQNIDQMLTEVEKRYSNNSKYRLHYMTAREAYNVVKAAEDGATGNPHEYRDYLLKPYVYPLNPQT